MKTKQQLFDNAWRGIKAQEFKRCAIARNRSDDLCQYRGTGDSLGLRCAIGHNIPDTKYSPALEGMMAHTPAVRRAAGFAKADDEFAIQLQSAHDSGRRVSSRTPQGMQTSLRNLAADNGLTIPKGLPRKKRI